MKVLTPYGIGEVKGVGLKNLYSETSLDVTLDKDKTAQGMYSSDVVPLTDRALMRIIKPRLSPLGATMTQSATCSSSLTFIDPDVDINRFPNLRGETIFDINLTDGTIKHNNMWFTDDSIKIIQYIVWLGLWVEPEMMSYENKVAADKAAEEFSTHYTAGDMQACVLINAEEKLLHSLRIIAPSPQGLIWSWAPQ